jgi:transposase
MRVRAEGQGRELVRRKALRRPRYEHRRIVEVLKRQRNGPVSHHRVQRNMKKEGLQVRTRRRK